MISIILVTLAAYIIGHKKCKNTRALVLMVPYGLFGSKLLIIEICSVTNPTICLEYGTDGLISFTAGKQNNQITPDMLI